MALAPDIKTCTTCTVILARYPQYTASIAGYPRLEAIPRIDVLKESEVKLMSKAKALLLGIVCVAFAVAFVVSKDMTGVFAFSSGAVLFLGVWFYKYRRDRLIIARAHRERRSR